MKDKYENTVEVSVPSEKTTTTSGMKYAQYRGLMDAIYNVGETQEVLATVVDERFLKIAQSILVALHDEHVHVVTPWAYNHREAAFHVANECENFPYGSNVGDNDRILYNPQTCSHCTHNAKVACRLFSAPMITASQLEEEFPAPEDNIVPMQPLLSILNTPSDIPSEPIVLDVSQETISVSKEDIDMGLYSKSILNDGDVDSAVKSILQDYMKTLAQLITSNVQKYCVLSYGDQLFNLLQIIEGVVDLYENPMIDVDALLRETNILEKDILHHVLVSQHHFVDVDYTVNDEDDVFTFLINDAVEAQTYEMTTLFPVLIIIRLNLLLAANDIDLEFYHHNYDAIKEFVGNPHVVQSGNYMNVVEGIRSLNFSSNVLNDFDIVQQYRELIDEYGLGAIWGALLMDWRINNELSVSRLPMVINILVNALFYR